MAETLDWSVEQRQEEVERTIMILAERYRVHLDHTPADMISHLLDYDYSSKQFAMA